MEDILGLAMLKNSDEVAWVNKSVDTAVGKEVEKERGGERDEKFQATPAL